MSSWGPVLEGAEARSARDAVNAIAAALYEGLPPENETDFSLSAGAAGRAVLFGTLHRAGLGPADAGDRARALLDHATDLAASADVSPSLFAGVPGAAWAATHLLEPLYGENTEDPAEEMDEAILEMLAAGAAVVHDYDLVVGLVGCGVYALERLPRPAAREALERCLDALAGRAERREGGVTWRTSPDLLTPSQRRFLPGGCYDLGLAHGVPGVVALLGSAHAAGPQRPEITELLRDAVTWLLSQRLEDGAGSRFPASVRPDGQTLAARTGWCYGDLGVAASLLVAARGAAETSWERDAVDLARGAARRSLEETLVKDAAFCHGACGLAHLFNRFFQATGDEELRDAARTWYARTLSMRTEGEGWAGFPAFRPDEDGAWAWTADASVMSGEAGIALALISAIAPIEPEWDRMFLLSSPRNIP